VTNPRGPAAHLGRCQAQSLWLAELQPLLISHWVMASACRDAVVSPWPQGCSSSSLR
jgi:hypothetical protein